MLLSRCPVIRSLKPVLAWTKRSVIEECGLAISANRVDFCIREQPLRLYLVFVAAFFVILDDSISPFVKVARIVDVGHGLAVVQDFEAVVGELDVNFVAMAGEVVSGHR